jgi:hypothetical protein
MTVERTFISRPEGERGAASSEDFDAMLGELATDLSAFAAQINANENGIRNMSRLLFEEFMNARNHAARHAEDVRNQNKLAAILNNTIYTMVGFRSFRGPDYYVTYDNVPSSRRARIEPLYGEMLLPFDDVENRMYTEDPESGTPVLPEQLSYTLTPEDNGGTATGGTVNHAFNGNNRDYWIRKVAFPLESDVDSVAVELDITLPDTFISSSNMLVLHPYPLGQLEVEEIKYATTNVTPTTDLPGFSVARGVGFKRWHFDDLSIVRLKIKLRQRNFIEENGQKVFYLGAQEIALQLIGFDKTAGQAQPINNNSAIVVVEAPDGYNFNVLNRLYSVPDYATFTSDEIAFRIYADAALTDLVWDSTTMSRLEDSSVDISSRSTDKIYILVNLAFLTSEGKSPILDDIVLGYTVA